MKDARASAIGRLAAAGWLVSVVLVIRIATNGTFTDLAVQSSSQGRALLAIAGLGLVGLGIVLAGLLATRPQARVFTASWLGALVLASYGIVQLALRHESAAVVIALGVAIGVLSILGWRQASSADQP